MKNPNFATICCPYSKKRATYDTEAKKLADLLGSKFRGVKFDAKKDHGTAGLGYFKISFRSSSNDPAVIVEFDKVDRIKGDADMIMDALKDMQAALNI